jgi:anti-sigma factor RsiW
MEHLDIQLAHRLIRGQLDAEEHARWQGHLERCTRCRSLVAGERAWMTVLDLGEQPAPPTPSPEGLIGRTGCLSLRASARRGPGLALAVVGGLIAIGLASTLAWQVTGAADGPAAMADELHIPPELQDRVVLNLHALATLDRDPWLVEHYEAVRTLEQLIAERRP